MNIFNKFSLLHINARSLLRKLDYLQVLLEVANVKFDVIALSETWKTDLSDQLLHTNGQKKISNRRCDGRMGGGVVLFVKNSTDFVIKATDKSTTFESIFIELFCLKKQ